MDRRVTEARDESDAFHPLADRACLLNDPDVHHALEALREDLSEHVVGPPHDDAALLLVRRRRRPAEGELTEPQQAADRPQAVSACLCPSCRGYPCSALCHSTTTGEVRDMSARGDVGGCIAGPTTDLVRGRFPDIPRPVSGRNRVPLLPEHGFDTARLSAGSEVTVVRAGPGPVPAPSRSSEQAAARACPAPPTRWAQPSSAVAGAPTEAGAVPAGARACDRGRHRLDPWRGIL